MVPGEMNSAETIKKTNAAAANAVSYGTMIAPVVVSAVGKLKEAVHIKNLRGVPIFFGVGDMQPFNIPGKDEVIRRARYNGLFFATNYAAIGIILCIITILMNPLFMIALCVVIFGWVKVVNLADNNDQENPIVINGRRITGNERLIGMTLVSVIALTLFGGSVIFSALTVSGACITTHAVLRASVLPEEDELGFLTDVNKSVEEYPVATLANDNMA